MIKWYSTNLIQHKEIHCDTMGQDNEITLSQILCQNHGYLQLGLSTKHSKPDLLLTNNTQNPRSGAKLIILLGSRCFSN